MTIPVPDDIYSLGESLQVLHPIPVPDDIYTLWGKPTGAPPHSSSRWYLHTLGKAYRCSTPFQFQMISTHLEKAYRCSTPFQFQVSTHTVKALQLLHPIIDKFPQSCTTFKPLQWWCDWWSWPLMSIQGKNAKHFLSPPPLSQVIDGMCAGRCVLACRCACTRVCTHACVIMCCQSYCKVLCTRTSCERWSAVQILFIIKQFKCKTSPRKWRTKTFILF